MAASMFNLTTSLQNGLCEPQNRMCVNMKIMMPGWSSFIFLVSGLVWIIFCASSLITSLMGLKNGVSLINEIDSSRFPLLLSRIIGKLTIKGENIFSDDEQAKLCNAFNVDSNDLQSILDTSVFILEQAAYHTVKPATFTQHLKSIQLSDDKIEMFVNVWTTHGKSVTEELKQRSLTPKQLDSVKWKLNLQMAQSSKSKMKTPSAVIELGLKGNKESENICLEFTHEELYSFYDQLERIKSQLDALR